MSAERAAPELYPPPHVRARNRASLLAALPPSTLRSLHRHLVTHTPALLDDVSSYPLYVNLLDHNICYLVNSPTDVHDMIAEVRAAIDGTRATGPCPGGSYRAESPAPPKHRCAGCENEHSHHATGCYSGGSPLVPAATSAASPHESSPTLVELCRALVADIDSLVRAIRKAAAADIAWWKRRAMGVLAPRRPNRRS